MPGPPPKDPALRVRRNRTSTRTTLPAAPNARKRPLPKRIPNWHAETRRTWDEWWASPQASEWTEVHQTGLMRLILLVEDFWVATDAKSRREASTEIRLQGALFGLTPIDERRLQWERARGEEAERKRRAPARPKASGKIVDARELFRSG